MSTSFSADEVITAVGIKLADERQSRESVCRDLVAADRELAAEVAQLRERLDEHGNNIVPPELAEQIKAAIHLLYESPPIEHRNAPPRSAYPLPPPRPSRIERNESGGYTLIYDEPQP